MIGGGSRCCMWRSGNVAVNKFFLKNNTLEPLQGSKVLYVSRKDLPAKEERLLLE